MRELEDNRLFYYYRNGVILYTPSLVLAHKRKDVGSEIGVV